MEKQHNRPLLSQNRRLKTTSTLQNTRWRAWRLLARGWTLVVAHRRPSGTEFRRAIPCSSRRKPCCVTPRYLSRGVFMPSTRRASQRCFMELVKWAYTQSMFHALRIWELGKFDVFLCLRRRTNETRTGRVVARQLKKDGRPRVQTLAMRRVQLAAWQMIRSPERSQVLGRFYHMAL